MADFVKSLVDMGFDQEKASKAVQLTGNSSVEAAMEWLLTNSDSDPVTSNVLTAEPKEGQEAVDSHGVKQEPEVVRSYKCEDCGKQFKNETEMEFHASKTQHTNFSESTEEKKPLTAEEKAEQLKRIEEKMKEKRAEREAREKLEAIEKEKFRVKTGKDVSDAKRRFEEQQMKELVEERRREKLDEKQARERVRAQIEADKAARKAKQDTEKAAGAGTIVSPPVTPTASPLSSSSNLPAQKKDYTETKLQLRLPSGKALVQTFGAQEPLAAVRVYIEINRDDGVTGPFNLMQSFPRKVFQGEDYDAPLESLGLVPSAVLMVTRAV